MKTISKLIKPSELNDAKLSKVIAVRPGAYRVKNPTRTPNRNASFNPGEYDLSVIGKMEDVDGYVRQAFTKKTTLLMKEGYSFDGKNEAASKYVKRRIKEIMFMSDQTWDGLLTLTAWYLVSRSNFFWVKVRNEEASSGVKGINNKQPIAAYFPLDPDQVRFKTNKSGKITKYIQVVAGGESKEFSPDNIVHFHRGKKPSNLLGTPDVWPVIEDVRELRRLEEDITVLVYNHLFPLFQYKVGTEKNPATKILASDGSYIDEIEAVRADIEMMPTEGGIVTPERHEIKVIGSEGQALEITKYLEHFKSRVFAGLGASSVDFGEGGTANRSTAATMSAIMIDSVKGVQQAFATQLNQKVFQELYAESAGEFDIFDEDSISEISFNEIDIENQIRININAQLMYQGELLDINEARAITGREAVKPEQEALFFNQRVTAQNMIMQAALTPAPVAGSGEGGTSSKKAGNLNKNKSTPNNQHGKKSGPGKTQNDLLELREQLLRITGDSFEENRKYSKLEVDNMLQSLVHDALTDNPATAVKLKGLRNMLVRTIDSSLNERDMLHRINILLHDSIIEVFSE